MYAIDITVQKFIRNSSHDNYILCIDEPYMIAHHLLAYPFQNTDIDNKQTIKFMCDIQFMWVISLLF